MKIIHEVQGERRFFKTCYHWLAKNYPEIARRNMRQIPFYSRWDNLYCLVDTPLETEMFQFMKEQLALDIQSKTPSLLAKWMKSTNCSSQESRNLGNKTREVFGMTHKQYRKTLSVLRERINVLERLMSENRWGEIEFDAIPSKAGLKYKNAFARHDIERMRANPKAQSYADFAKDKTKTVNAEVLNPVDIANKIFNNHNWWNNNSTLSETDRAMLDKYWYCLKDYYNGREENGIAVVDVSGSMAGQPMNAAVSMGAYIAERGKGPFKDHFITFSSHPRLVKFEGIDITDKFLRARSADWGMNTNIEATMDLLLDTAIQNGCTQDEIPERVYIFSDQEYDGCMQTYENRRVYRPETLFETIEKRWLAAGYQMPKVIFWNLDARQDNIPALGDRFSYVSGFSMNMIEAILSGKDGYDLMMEKLDSERYSVIR